jgi:hypothetical protein
VDFNQLQQAATRLDAVVEPKCGVRITSSESSTVSSDTAASANTDTSASQSTALPDACTLASPDDVSSAFDETFTSTDTNASEASSKRLDPNFSDECDFSSTSSDNDGVGILVNDLASTPDELHQLDQSGPHDSIQSANVGDAADLSVFQENASLSFIKNGVHVRITIRATNGTDPSTFADGLIALGRTVADNL